MDICEIQILGTYDVTVRDISFRFWLSLHKNVFFIAAMLLLVRPKKTKQNKKKKHFVTNALKKGRIKALVGHSHLLIFLQSIFKVTLPSF